MTRVQILAACFVLVSFCGRTILHISGGSLLLQSVQSNDYTDGTSRNEYI